VPDWPTTYGWNMFTFPPSKWVGGIFYEHGHRLIASTVGLLTIVLACWLWLAEPLRWMRESDEVEVLYIDDQPADVQLPSALELAIAETEPGVRGETASGGGTKPAVLETGTRIQVPLFINVGDVVRVDTRSGEYVSRA